MSNLFCLLKDITKSHGVDRVFMEDGTPLVSSSFFPTTRLPKLVLRVFYRVRVVVCRKECIRDYLWYTIYLGYPHDYHTLKLYIKK